MTIVTASRWGIRPRTWRLALSTLFLGCSLIGPSVANAADSPSADSINRGGESWPADVLQPGGSRNVLLAPGSPIAIPTVTSSQAAGGDSESTTLYVSNHSDSDVTATFNFRGDDGADLQVPVATGPGNASSAVSLNSSHELVVGANDTGRVVIRAATPSRTGWAEVTASATAALSVTAETVRTVSSSTQDFNEVPSTPAFRRAWLVVDSAGGYSTSLVLVNSGSDADESFHLKFQSGDSSCEHTMPVPAKGRSTVAISTSLACSASKVGTVEINAPVLFTGIAKVSRSGQSDTFIRSLTGLPDMDPVPLEAWTVTDGGVMFEHLSSTDCIDLDSRMLVGVSYTVRTSVWQARANEASEWSDLPETVQTAKICAHDPSEPGEYRGVAEITVDGVPGVHSSSTTVTIAAASTPAGGPASIPSFVVGEEAVQFGSLSGECVSSTDPIQVDWVTYQIHTSRWQRRDNATSGWSDVEGTAETGRICAFDPETAGEYRAVAEISRNGVRGTYASSNTLAGELPTEPTTPTAQPGEEECSELVGCFIPLPAGTFRMGSNSSEAGDDETPLTNVTISGGVQIAKYELTHAQWELIMGPAAAYVESDCEETCPIVAVAFLGINDIKVPLFLDLLNQRDTSFTYRLPTEAEWEYAARAGTTGDRYGNVDDIAWHSGNSDNKIHPIGQKSPNAWGFYDMLGNAYEWVQDFYGPYPGGTAADPTGPTSGSRRIVRGGSYLRGASDARAPNRQPYSAGQLAPHVGIRLARVRK